jgi:hypothetical protein
MSSPTESAGSSVVRTTSIYPFHRRSPDCALGITAEAVRMRIKRGTLRSERQAGRVFVLLGQGQPTEQPTDRPGEPNALISQMQGTIDSLERRLEEAAERDRENRRIIVALTSRIPAIEAPSEERESSETVEEGPDRAEPRPPTGGAQEGAQKPWWRRVIGG